MREDIVNNPVKMARIYHELEKQLETEKNSKKSSKKSKKEKKEKKEKKSKTSHNNVATDRSNETESDDSRYRKSNEKDNKLQKSHENSKISGMNQSSSSSSYSSSNREINDLGNNSNKEEILSSSQARSSSDKKYGYHDESEYTENRNNKYGLVESKNNNSSVGGDKTHTKSLGPDPNLLAKNYEKEKKEQEERNRQKKEDIKSIDPNEKKRRLEAMQMDAAVHDQRRMLHNVPKDKNTSSYDRKNHDSNNFTEQEGKYDETEKRVDAKFLRDMRSEVYNGGGTSMEERIKQQRHYTQRVVDMDRNSYKNK